MSERLKAVIAAPTHWTSDLQVGTHHIARTLVAAGWDVAYLSDPLSPFHLARRGRPDIRDRWRIWRAGGSSDLNGHLVTWVPMTLVSPRVPMLDLLNGFSQRWLARSGSETVRWLAGRGYERPDLLWIDSVVWDRLPELVTAERSVLRIADLGSGFPRHQAGFGAMERRIASMVDVVVYTADSLHEHAVALGSRDVRQMPNGVDLARFAARMPEPLDLSAISPPRVIYVGAMDSWFDFTLVSQLAAALPAISFVLIGPDHVARRRLPRHPNLHVLGSRRPSQVPGYLQHSQVGLIPFDVRGHRQLVDAIQPLKLYEYLASGLPVVTARWREMEALHSPALLYDDVDGALKAITQAIYAPPDRETSGQWVRASDWSRRLDPVLRSLGLPPIPNAAT